MTLVIGLIRVYEFFVCVCVWVGGGVIAWFSPKVIFKKTFFAVYVILTISNKNRDRGNLRVVLGSSLLCGEYLLTNVCKKTTFNFQIE